MRTKLKVKLLNVNDSMMIFIIIIIINDSMLYYGKYLPRFRLELGSLEYKVSAITVVLTCHASYKSLIQKGNSSVSHEKNKI